MKTTLLFLLLYIATGTKLIAQLDNFFVDENKGIISGQMNFWYEDRDGKIWIGGENGVSCFDGKSWTNFKAGENGLAASKKGFNAMCADKDNNLFVYFTNVWDNTQHGFYSENNMEFSDVLLNINVIIEDFSMFDGKKWTSFEKSKDLPEGYLLNVFRDKNKTLWYINEENVARFNGSEWVKYDKNNGLPSNKIVSVGADDQFVWISTKEGLASFDGKNWITYTNEAGVSLMEIRRILQLDKHGTGFFTPKALVVYNNGKWKSYSMENGYCSNQVSRYLVDKNGDVWLGTDKGLMQFNGEKLTLLMKDKWILHMVYDEKIGIWIATYYGPALWDGTSLKEYTGFAKKNTGSHCGIYNGMPWYSNSLQAACLQDGAIKIFDKKDYDGFFGNLNYIGIDKKGKCYFTVQTKKGHSLVRYNGQGWDIIEIPFTHGNAFVWTIIGSMQDEKQNFWLSHANGLFMYDGEKWAKNFGPEYSSRDISKNNLSQFAKDSKGGLWITSGRSGIYYFPEGFKSLMEMQK